MSCSDTSQPSKEASQPFLKSQTPYDCIYVKHEQDLVVITRLFQVPFRADLQDQV